MARHLEHLPNPPQTQRDVFMRGCSATMSPPVAAYFSRIVKRLRQLCFLWLFVIFLAPDSGNTAFPDADAYSRAQMAYQNGRYQEALARFAQAIKKVPFPARRSPIISGQIALSFFRLGRFARAQRLFTVLARRDTLIPDYFCFYAARSALARGDTQSAHLLWQSFHRRFPTSPLQPLMDSLQVHVFLQQQQWDSARFYANRFPDSKGPLQRFRLMSLWQVANQLRDSVLLRQVAGEMLQASLPDSLQLTAAQYLLDELVREEASLPEREVLFRFALKHSLWEMARKIIAIYSSRAEAQEWVQLARLQLAYARHQYDEVVRLSRKWERQKHSKPFLRQARLLLARSLWRLGDYKQGIQAYLNFQKKHSRDPLAKEALWKVAGWYEKQGLFQQADRIYKRLIHHYPHTGLADEARFRRGLMLYRQGKWAKARARWQHELAKLQDAEHRMRFRYWIGKCYQQEGQWKAWQDQLLLLVEEPLQTYYNLKALFLLRQMGYDFPDLDSLFWNMPSRHASYLGHYLNRFRRMIAVHTIFGERFFLMEYQAFVQSHPDLSWQQAFALAELMERLHYPGLAFRQFRRIYNHHFRDANWKENLFLLKRLYPFYFDSLVTTWSRTYRLPAPLLLAIIKKESAFEPRIVSYAKAHGLMQLLPSTGREVAQRLGMVLKNNQDLFDASRNIHLGSYYFQSLRRRFEGNVYAALAAYNAGPHRVKRWRKDMETEDDDLFMELIEFSQTRLYVRRVMRYFWTYLLILFPEWQEASGTLIAEGSEVMPDEYPAPAGNFR